MPDYEIIRGMPMEEYHRLPYASSHRIGNILRSPAHAKCGMENQFEPTDSMLLGTACHDAILEPEKASTFIVSGKCTSLTKKGEPCGNNGIHLYNGQWACGVHGKVPGDEVGKTFLPQSDFDTVESVRQSVLTHAEAKRLLDARESTETVFIWTDKTTGVKCKLRTDALIVIDGIPHILDLKTTKDASPKEFVKSIFHFGYHRQGAFYLDGTNACGIPTERFYIIAVETIRPFCVSVYELGLDVLSAGYEENTKALELWAQCEASGKWPGYTEEIQVISMPEWRK